MNKPIVSFICWNRAGLTARNLTALLKTTDDFELYIVDSNSADDTWEFIKTLKDERIKEKKKLNLNRGCAYAINYVMSKRKKEQFFFHLDSDTCMMTSDWITKFMEAMNEYPEIGAASTVKPSILRYYSIYSKKLNKHGVEVGVIDALIGNCLCIRPEVIDILGYFNEETGRCDSDYSIRINKFTNYKMALVKSIVIDQKQKIECSECIMSNMCKVKNNNITCFKIRDNKYQNEIFEKKSKELVIKYYQEIEEGKRTPYCASIHDEKSMKDNYYDRNRAEQIFNYYIKNSN